MRKIFLLFLSILSGILFSLPWLIQGGGWALFFAFIPLFYAETFSSGKSTLSDSFGRSYPAFFIWNLLASWWIGYVSVSGMLFMVAANAMLMSLVWWASGKAKSILGPLSGYFSLLVFWLSFEFLNHRGILPWPWLTLGNGFANSIRMVQWYEFTGVLGGSCWVLLVNSLIFETFKTVKRIKSGKIPVRTISLFAVFLLPATYSYYRYASYSESGERRHALVLQPNIDPFTEKFAGMTAGEQTERLVNLCREAVTDSTDLVLAPETALPVFWEDSLLVSEKMEEIQELIKLHPKVNFIAGAITRKARTNAEAPADGRASQPIETYDSFNSALLINARQKPQFCHKTILVAGVERTPLREYLNFLPDFLIDPGGSVGELTPGKVPGVLETTSGERAAPVICFESVFGNLVRQQVLQGASYLLILTNDGWWKRSAGVWQHFSYAKIRAVETRRSVIRSANTGISACINPRGEVVSQSAMATACTLSCNIRTNNRLTFYTTHGDFLGEASLWLSAGVLLYVFFCRRKARA